MGYEFSKKSMERLEGVDCHMKEIMREALDRSPIDFGIPRDGGFRTVKRQKELYAQGRTTKGNIVTQANGVKNKSNHQGGKAIDIFAYINGKASWDAHHMNILAGVILSTSKEMGMELTWGGTFGSDDWNGWDKAHYELR